MASPGLRGCRGKSAELVWCQSVVLDEPLAVATTIGIGRDRSNPATDVKAMKWAFFPGTQHRRLQSGQTFEKASTVLGHEYARGKFLISWLHAQTAGCARDLRRNLLTDGMVHHAMQVGP